MIKLSWKSFLTGIALSYLVLALLFLLFIYTCDFAPPISEQVLPSGRIAKIASFQLTWGVDHGDRYPDHDSILIEYITSKPDLEDLEMDKETTEVFELIRSTVEIWKFKSALVYALPYLDRRL